MAGSQPGDLGYGIVNVTYDNRDRVATRQDQKGNTLTYDANGNRLNSSAGTVYSWDLDNRLVAAGNHSFEYDALGRRVIVSIGNETSVMVCPDGQLIAVYALAATTSAPAKTFIYGSYVDEPLMQVSGQEKFYFSRNQQYSITGATNAAGQIVERYAYTAYGETIILSPAGTPRVTSSVGNPFTYTGRYNHTEVGLIYFRARYYNTATGEFISRDPLEYVNGMSLYRGYFVPNGMDPSGLLSCEEQCSITCGLSAAIACNLLPPPFNLGCGLTTAIECVAICSLTCDPVPGHCVLRPNMGFGPPMGN